MKLSCVTASYVMDLLGYPGHFDWGAASQAIMRAPMLETIDSMLARLAPARLDGIEFWTPHTAPGNLTPTLASAIRQRLVARGMVVSACAGGVPNPLKDPNGCEEILQVARLLKTDTIAGHMGKGSLAELKALCAAHGVRVAFENGGERSAAEILNVIQGGSPWVEANLDTGNLAARGGDPVQTVRALGSRLQYVHFKDVPGQGDHECVALGAGVVDVRGVIRELKAVGYDGWLSIEVETYSHDPTAEIIASAETLRRLWAE
jgi:sugar phosphate isomerase/epimerase